MSSKFPRPANYPYEDVFYHDGNVALIWGCYKDNPKRSLGMRWTIAENPAGYPNLFGHGMWMVVPDNIAYFILNGIANTPEEEKNILKSHILVEALKELQSQY